MNVLVKSSSGITQVSADSKLLSQRKVFIEGEISSESACEFIKKILILNEEDTDKPIDVLHWKGLQYGGSIIFQWKSRAIYASTLRTNAS